MYSMNKLIMCPFNKSKLNRKFGQENTSPGRRNPKTTNLVPKFSTWFLRSSRKFCHINILFQRPKILMRKSC